MNFIKYYYHHKPQISATTKLTRCQTDTSYKDEYIKLERNNINESFRFSNYDDLYNLKKIKYPNLEGVIAGKSFYSGRIMLEKALQIIKLNA